MKRTIILLILISMSLFAKVIEITNEHSLTSAINNKEIVVVDYYANWCGPCKLLSPLLNDFSESYPKISFYKIDVDQQKRLAQKAQITSIPFVQFYKGGRLVHVQRGLLKKSEYEQILDTLLVLALPPTLQELSVAAFADSIEATGAILVDVRTKDEFNQSHIKNAKLIPIQEFMGRMDELKEYKDSPIYLYCRSGNRSGMVGQMLIQSGYKQVFHLENGIKSWIREGKDVLKP